MGNRILFILAFILSIPVVIITAFLSAIPMPIIAVFIWIFKGDEDEKLMDWIQSPFVWAMSLPWIITNRD